MQTTTRRRFLKTSVALGTTMSAFTAGAIGATHAMAESPPPPLVAKAFRTAEDGSSRSPGAERFGYVMYASFSTRALVA